MFKVFAYLLWQSNVSLQLSKAGNYDRAAAITTRLNIDNGFFPLMWEQIDQCFQQQQWKSI